MNFNDKWDNFVELIRDRFKDKPGVQFVLDRVKDLAELGEYNLASEELARLRVFLAQQMPKPYLTNDRAKDPVYGISFVNPDNNKWELSLMLEGGLRGILLSDRYSVKEEGILIQVINPILVYGPEGVKTLTETMDQETFLKTVGQGAAMYTGHIERECFTPFNGKRAYDAIVRVNFPGVKARILCAQQKEFILMFLMLADSNTFEEKIKAYERIIESCVRIE
jgi:hypothetical protein